jgi:hypothetical protein
MTRSKQVQGEHWNFEPAEGRKGLQQSKKTRMKVIDKKYLDTAVQMEKKKIEKLKENLHFFQSDVELSHSTKRKRSRESDDELEDEFDNDDDSDDDVDDPNIPLGTKKHVIIADCEKEREEFNPSKYFDTPLELVSNAFNRPTFTQLSKTPIVIGGDVEDLRNAQIRLSKRYKELNERMDRQHKMEQQIDTIQTQLLTQTKGKRTKIVKLDKFGEEIPGRTIYKFGQQRKK